MLKLSQENGFIIMARVWNIAGVKYRMKSFKHLRILTLQLWAGSAVLIAGVTVYTNIAAAQSGAVPVVIISSAPDSSSALRHNISQSEYPGAEMTAGAQDFIESLAQRALSFLDDDSLSQNQKRQAFRYLLESSFDMDTIGRFSMGRYWRASTVQQREEYLQLFRRMVVDVYSSRFSDYQGQKFIVRGARPDGRNDVLVASHIVPDQGGQIRIDWRVRYRNGQFRVVDVIVEGVSMSMTQRSDFSAVIQRGGGDVRVLLAHLRN